MAASQGARPDGEGIRHHRVVVVGAGMAGVATGVALQRAGIDDYVILERAGDVGGTWRDNTYPGCQCDIASHLYSFSFAPNPEWSRTYPLQSELRAYVRDTARRLGVLPRVRLRTTLLDATWDADAGRWHLVTSAGDLTAGAVVMANGPLSEPRIPAVPGLDRFTGAVFHSAHWDHDVDLTGRRVAVVGTGASAIQFVPEVQKRAAGVVLFQRTAPWVLAHPGRAINDWERRLFRRVPLAQRLVRLWCYWYRELEVVGFTRRPPLMQWVARMSRRHLERQVPDAGLRAKLTPRYQAGCKRLLLSNTYYPALCRPNVTVVAGGLGEVHEHSVVDSTGTEHDVDTIIFGTGFAVTDNPTFARVRGRDGETLAERWLAEGLSAYKGITVPGFPNLFVLTGPNTGVGHTSLLVMIEAQVRYVVDALGYLGRRDRGDGHLEVRPDAAEAWTTEVQRRMQRTVWQTGGCASWYQDSQGRNGTLWPDFTFKYALSTRRFDADAYRYRSAGQPIDHRTEETFA